MKTETENLICAKLLELMHDKPFDQIKVAQLAQYCEISRSTFYAHFDSIYAVVQRIEDDLMAGLVAESTVDMTGKADTKELRAAFTYVHDHLQTFQVLFGPNGDPSFLAKFANRNKRVLHRLASKTNSKATSQELLVANEYTRAGKMAAIYWWTTHANEISVNDMVKIMEKLGTAVHDILW